MNKVLGYCKECGTELTLQDKIKGYNIYECRHCYYPAHADELEDTDK